MANNLHLFQFEKNNVRALKIKNEPKISTLRRVADVLDVDCKVLLP